DEEIRVVTAGFFDAIGMTLRQGRFFGDAEPAPVAVVNESFARRYGAVGTRLRLIGDPRWWSVAGVAGDVREFGLDADARPTLYVPFEQLPAGTLTLVVRSKAAAGEVLRETQQILAGVDPRAAAYQAQPLAQMLSASLAQRSFALELLHGFAALALLLAGLGLYGVLAYSVAQRTREIGVRMALGARPAQALALIGRESAAVVGAGLAAGFAGALACARLFAGLLYGVGPWDAAALSAAVLLLCAVAAAATLLPARRATRVDPAIALRAE
ncbi:MAG: FtsX-like permease family protein, partial [Myxococcales bacterium]